MYKDTSYHFALSCVHWESQGPLICAQESSPCFSPPELYPSVGHLGGATRERLPQRSPNPGESKDASMAAGLSFRTSAPGRAAHFNKCKVILSTSKHRATHTLLYMHTHTHTCEPELICDGELLVLGAKYGRVIQ